MRNKYTAWILAIIFWWIGFHKFYLWQYWQWIIYILFSWSFIPMILWLFEWITYLLNSQKYFDENYNLDYMLKLKLYENSKT